MRLAAGLAAVIVAAAILLLGPPASQSSPGEAAIRRALAAGTGVIELPAGSIEIAAEIEIPSGAHDLEIRGALSGTTLHAADHFRGRAIFRCERATRVRFSNFSVDGNRGALERRAGLPGFSTTFARFAWGNGILAVRSESLAISQVRFANIAGFAVLVSHSHGITIDGVRIENSGSRTAAGRNNTTGGILLEEGTRDFAVIHCDLINVRGNGVWTHSLATAASNSNGSIAENHFARIGRDAIQVGQGTSVRVEDNRGSEIGLPLEDVDIEHGATPVAIDTAGNTTRSGYARNIFEEVNGKCIDLDGFHHGEVRANACINRFGADHYPFGNQGIVLNNSDPSMRSEWIELTDNQLDGTLYSGIFVIGEHHHIVRNRLRRINLAHCGGAGAKPGCTYAPDQPDLLRAGIYLAERAERPAPAQANLIEANEISGFGMSFHCIAAAPGVSLAANTIAHNTCQDDPAQ